MKTNARYMSAFTLIEIMIVVTIIGVLAAIAIPSFRKAIDKSRREACTANLKSIEGAKLTWATEQRKPLTETPTDEDLFGRGTLLAKKPACPAGGTYTINSCEMNAMCSIASHTLE